MPRYAQAGGLLDADNRLTALGRRIAAADITLERKESLWLIHYALARQGGIAPKFWGYLFENTVRPGDNLDRERVGELIRDVTQDQQLVSISAKTAADAATVFLKTYSSGESLGGLSLLQDCGSGHYLVLEPESPSALVFGFAVADYWASHAGSMTSVWIDEFNKTGGPAHLLLMGRGQVNQAMRELSRQALATVQLTQPPYQFSPLWTDPDELLDRIYAHRPND